MTDETRTRTGVGSLGAVDWAATALGDRRAWSAELRSAAGLVSQTTFAAALFWGPDLRMVYNDAYREIIGDKHPAALGARVRDIFPEVWETIAPLFAEAMSGATVTLEDSLLPLERHGFLEDCWFTFCYSPVRDADGTVVGVLDLTTETTRQRVDRRRLVLLSRLADVLGRLDHVSDVARRATELLNDDPRDFPSARIMLRGEPLPDQLAQPGAGELRREHVGEDRLALLGLGAEGDAEPLGVLIARLSPGLAMSDEYLEYIRLVGATVTQAVERVAAAESDRELSRSLQLSLLGRPPAVPRLEVAARYLPAADRAFVGGDWYDAFPRGVDGAVLSIGDVAGHDRSAAATMSQLRNVLRGIVLAGAGTPAEILRRLEAIMGTLDVEQVATTVLLELDAPAADGTRLARWSNAGHLPPVLLRSDGAVDLLERRPDPLLGVGLAVPRTDHHVLLRPGDGIVLYTDGLVERRGTSLTSGLDWLVEAVGRAAAPEIGATADGLLGLLDAELEDDVAILVARLT